jgi:tetratricopeptide (TPR) repeat protein
MREVIKHFEGMGREDILATRPGLWGDYGLLDVLQHFHGQKDWGRAMAVAELILRSPEHSDAVDYAELCLDLANYYRRLDAEAALRWAHALIAYSEQHEHGLNRVGNWRDLAEIYLAAGDLDTALAMFTRILQTDPGDIWTYNILGFELPRAGLYHLAVEALDKGLQLIKRNDPERLRDQLMRQRREVVDEQARRKDRTDEVDPEVLAEFRGALALPGEGKVTPPSIRRTPYGEVRVRPYLPPIKHLLSLGAARDDAVYSEILEPGKALVPELIRMAFDPQLHERPADDPTHHAPGHAIALLRALRKEAKLDQLAEWLDQADGDWYAELLTTRCGKIGGYTTSQLEALAADTDYNVYARVSAIGGLTERARQSPGQGEQIVKFMRYLLNRPEAHEVAEEEIFLGFLIGEALDMQARELYPDIKRAYDEDRVDTKIAGLDDVHHEWGLSPVPQPRRRSDGMYLRLRCKECGRVREHFVQHVLVDTLTLDRSAKGEGVPYDPYVMDREITCPKCSAVDRYEMTPEGYLTLLGPGRIPAIKAALSGGEPPTDLPRNPRVHYFQSHAFGRPMHPLMALEEYKRRIAKKPKDAKLHLKMGNLYRTLSRHSDALDRYRQAYDLNPENAEAALTLAMCAHDLGDRKTAKGMYERVLELSSQKGWLGRIVKGDVSELESVAVEGLVRLKRKQSSLWAEPWEREEATSLGRSDEDRPQRPSGGAKPQKKRRKRRRKRRKR